MNRDHLNDILHNCLHCGLCLPVCPTYSITLKETSSPRGRIRLMKEVEEGKLSIGDQFVEEMYFCLDCQACQTICPAGVQYGELVEDARTLIAEKGKEPVGLRLFKSLFLFVLKSKPLTKFIARALKLYRKIGFYEAVEQSGILNLLPESIKQKHRLLPEISENFFDESIQEIITPLGEIKGRVAFLSGCIMNVAFAEIHRDAIEVLVHNGYEVVIPKSQVCCGSLHGHNGERESAKTLARKNIDIFEKYEFEALIVDSAGCGAFLKEYGRLLAEDERYATRAGTLSKKIKDITEFISEKGFYSPSTKKEQCVTYHEACHLVHTQKISKQPREILQSIPGVEFIELPEATWCCGSAGIYNILRYEDSMQMLDRKLNNLESTKAEIVATANPGCHLQLEQGIKKRGLNIKVKHPVTLLAEGYRMK